MQNDKIQNYSEIRGNFLHFPTFHQKKIRGEEVLRHFLNRVWVGVLCGIGIFGLHAAAYRVCPYVIL